MYSYWLILIAHQSLMSTAISTRLRDCPTSKATEQSTSQCSGCKVPLSISIIWFFYVNVCLVYVWSAACLVGWYIEARSSSLTLTMASRKSDLSVSWRQTPEESKLWSALPVILASSLVGGWWHRNLLQLRAWSTAIIVRASTDVYWTFRTQIYFD